jgi:hypothetical protein
MLRDTIGRYRYCMAGSGWIGPGGNIGDRLDGLTWLHYFCRRRRLLEYVGLGGGLAWDSLSLHDINPSWCRIVRHILLSGRLRQFLDDRGLGRRLLQHIGPVCRVAGRDMNRIHGRYVARR